MKVGEDILAEASSSSVLIISHMAQGMSFFIIVKIQIRNSIVTTILVTLHNGNANHKDKSPSVDIFLSYYFLFLSISFNDDDVYGACA